MLVMCAYRDFTNVVYKYLLLLLAYFIHIPHQLNASDCYNKITKFGNSVWDYEDCLVYEVDSLPETAQYDIYAILEYTVDYPFYNLHLKICLTDTAGTALLDAVEDFNLFDSKTGEPSGSTHIWSNKIVAKLPIAKNLTLKRGESYYLSIGHSMRIDHLPGIKMIKLKIISLSSHSK